MHRKLGIQQLETRTMMAGDVSVYISPTDTRDLVIQGDGQDNSIVVQEVGEDLIRVSGRGTAPFSIIPTLINGSTRPVEFRVTDDIRISMQGGSDRVVIADLVMRNFAHNDLDILMGSGSDYLAIENSFVGDDASFDMGSGDDTVHIAELYVSDELNVLGNDGHDGFLIYDVGALHMQLFGGSGNDVAYVQRSRMNQLVVSLEAGDDYLYLAHNVASEVDLFGGSGNDELSTSLFRWNSFDAFANANSIELRGIF